MIAYQLLARLNHLVLCGQDEYGELEWMGTGRQWDRVEEIDEEDDVQEIPGFEGTLAQLDALKI
jgi:hypothetical protein